MAPSWRHALSQAATALKIRANQAIEISGAELTIHSLIHSRARLRIRGLALLRSTPKAF